MQTFKQFISEQHGSNRTVRISPKAAFELIAEHCPGVARQMKKQIIYRGGSGMNNEDPYHANSNVGKPRRSANTANYFTLWHDNHPDWADFPKRSRSFICSNDYSIANNFGDVHILVPYDNAHVGVVPDEDLFGAIGSPDGEDLSQFNEIITDVLEVVQKEHGLEHPRTYAELKKQLGLATRELLQSASDKQGKHQWTSNIDYALEHMKQTTSLTYYGVVDEMYSPKDKGFRHGKADTIKLPKEGCELYVQGEGILLPWSERKSERERFQDGYMELLEYAIGKYGWDLDA